MTKTCKNCNHNFKGRFCNNCGQSAETHEINFKTILHEIQHGILHIDKGILYTTKELFKRPGHTIREYLLGKRANHFKPFAYVLIISSIHALLTKISHKTNLFDDILLALSNSTAERPKGAYIFFISLIEWMKSHYAYSILIITPIISIASYLSFIKTKYNYFQHLIINSYIAGQTTVVFLIILPITFFIKDKEINDNYDNFKIIVGIIISLWTYFQFFNSIGPFKRVALTILTYILLLFIFMFLIITIFAFSDIIN